MADRANEVVTVIGEILTGELEFPRPVREEDELRRDLSLDSMGLTVLTVGLEDRFRVRLRDEDAEGVVTVADLARRVAQRLEETSA